MIIFLGDAGIKSLCRVADTADGRPFGELFEGDRLAPGVFI